MRDRIQKYIMDYLYLQTGTLCIVVSCYYTILWFIHNGVPLFWSVILSLIYIIFLNLIFENAVMLWIDSGRCIADSKLLMNTSNSGDLKKKAIQKKVLSITVFITWFLLASFSIISTIGGQYDALVKIESQSTNTSNKDNRTSRLLAIQQNGETMQKAIRGLEKELSTIEMRQSTLLDAEITARFKTTSKNLDDRADKIRSKIEELNEKINDLNMQKINIESTTIKIDSGNVYGYFERLTGISGFVIQFYLSFFPSIVVDFFAPISFAMFLFRERD